MEGRLPGRRGLWPQNGLERFNEDSARFLMGYCSLRLRVRGLASRFSGSRPPVCPVVIIQKPCLLCDHIHAHGISGRCVELQINGISIGHRFYPLQSTVSAGSLEGFLDPLVVLLLLEPVNKIVGIGSPWECQYGSPGHFIVGDTGGHSPATGEGTTAAVCTGYQGAFGGGHGDEDGGTLARFLVVLLVANCQGAGYSRRHRRVADNIFTTGINHLNWVVYLR